MEQFTEEEMLAFITSLSTEELKSPAFAWVRDPTAVDAFCDITYHPFDYVWEPEYNSEMYEAIE